MKKLLILMLVLGMASLASATPVMVVSNTTPTLGSTFTVTISGTSAEASGTDYIGGGYAGVLALDYDNYTDGADNPYISFVNVTVTPTIAAGAGAGMSDSTGNVQWIAAYGINPADETRDVDEGLWFTWTLNADSLGTTMVDFLNAGWTATIDDQLVTVIPEPVTIALLGLGALFLRRRK